MKRSILLVALVASTAAQVVSAQPYKSRSMGFYLGAGIETDVVDVKTNGAPTEWGGGGALVAGYGFSKRWSAFAQLSGARMSASNNDPNVDVGQHYTLAHLDVGTRVHFRAPQRMISPFAQLALSGRRVSNTVNGQDVSNSGGGLTLGGGVNAFVSTAVAVTASGNVTIGTFNRFEVNGDTRLIPAASIGVNTFRFSLGATWFPNPNPPPKTVRGSLK
ncbi:MAG TPA: outer membrane beta-barrel protein [Gemmatimonadaceae bacterium]